MNDKQIEDLKKENLHLRCVMREAAREMANQWEAHAPCDGLGPHLLFEYLSGKRPITAESNPYPNNEKDLDKKTP
jgi:hypothetical protein